MESPLIRESGSMESPLTRESGFHSTERLERLSGSPSVQDFPPPENFDIIQNIIIDRLKEICDGHFVYSYS